MRGPEGVPIGKLRRVKISNIIVYNADSEYTCTIAGCPGILLRIFTLAISGSIIKVVEKRRCIKRSPGK